MTFNHFPKIDNFHNVRKMAIAKAEYAGTNQAPITYRGKIKLHGTNAGIQIRPDGSVRPQSRSSLIAVGNDNMGFAGWVAANEDYFADLEPDLTIFGEWFGQGIMKGVAASGIGKKAFGIFAVQFGKTDDDESTVYIDPAGIANQIEHIQEEHDDIFILPWATDDIEIDWHDTQSLESAVEVLNREVEKVEAMDPWIKETFDIEGVGEGIVYYPISLMATHVCESTSIYNSMMRYDFSDWTFKAKGEKHKVVKQKNAVQIDPEVAASVNEFVDNVVTEARLEQGAREVNRGELEFDNKLIGPFIGWIGRDVKLETMAELEASDLNWKMVAKQVSDRARKWYMEQLTKI